jgi:hypothetical protein
MIFKAEPIVERMMMRERPNRFVLIVEDDDRDAELITEVDSGKERALPKLYDQRVEHRQIIPDSAVA